MFVPAQCLQVLAKLAEDAVAQAIRHQQQHRRLLRQRRNQPFDDRFDRHAFSLGPRLTVPHLQCLREGSIEHLGLLVCRVAQRNVRRRKARQVVAADQLESRPVDECAFAGIHLRKLCEPGRGSIAAAFALRPLCHHPPA